MTKKNDLLTPGTPVGYSEEFLPGSGIYDDGERLRAAVFGTESVDPKTMEMTITPAGKSIATVAKNDIVVGEITYLRDILASVRLIAVRGKEDRSILQNVEMTLHVSKADQGYVDDLAKFYRAGDIIRAKVIGLRGGPQLATDRPEFGVLQARSGDGHVMVRDQHRVKDPVTGRIENRKLASDYGSGVV